VLEIGAGTGVLTSELSRRAGRVLALELDAALARRLRRRFENDARVSVVQGDALTSPLPGRPFRVVANVPFAQTTPILRRLLDDPATQLLRADLVVQWGAAVKRCSQRPSTLLTMSWAPWFELTISRRLDASCFTPQPPVDAAVMTVTRRPDPLLRQRDRAAYAPWLREAFVRRPDATDLDVWDWTQLFRRSRMRDATADVSVSG
jgi:23S rRNA (adenine-N6)-dimethyltransferase